MHRWRPQSYYAQGRRDGISEEVLQNALQIGNKITSTGLQLPPLFTLNHFAHHSGVSYRFLRPIISRSFKQPYRTFKMQKRPDVTGNRQYRVISVPHPKLKCAQSWISKNILNIVPVHPSSIAYSPNSTIVEGVAPHCGCQWLLKIDIKNFFESISEVSVYRVFNKLGYEPLVSFELARICTKLPKRLRPWEGKRWKVHYPREVIEYYCKSPSIGYLPQGAPTSPMLSNLSMATIDNQLSDLALENGFIYTRYADDFTFSSTKESSRKDIKMLINEIYSLISINGFSPNTAKTRISPPGSRKIILGLLANGDKPRLTRDFRAKLRQHFYYLMHENHGPTRHAKLRGFESVIGLRNHVQGLVAYAIQVEPEIGYYYKEKLSRIHWPF